MGRFVLAQFRGRRGRAVALGMTTLVVAVSVVLLTASAEASKLRVQGSLESSYQAAYDVLVRPKGARTTLEERLGLVAPNFLSGSFGGITLAQYGQIKRVPDVQVAAPIANIGYVLPHIKFAVPINDLLTKASDQLYRIRLTWLANGGLSRYPDRYSAYVYYSRVARSRSLDVCGPIRNQQPPKQGPFDERVYLACFTGHSKGRPFIPELDEVDPSEPRQLQSGQVGTEFSIYFPILVAAIDPVEEAHLLHLDRAIVSGRYLRASDRVGVERTFRGEFHDAPAIASIAPYVDEQPEVTIERLSVPAGVKVREMLASGAAYTFLQGLRGMVAAQRWQPLAPLYARLLTPPAGSFDYWSVGGVRYRQLRGGRLSPLPMTNPPAAWLSPFLYPGLGGPNASDYWPAPPANEDLQFRPIIRRPISNQCPNHRCQLASFRVEGRFDPSRLPGFSPLSRVPLETYYPPRLEPADAASHKALHGRSLSPTQNLGDYIQQPPLLLTTLAGIEPFLHQRRFDSGVRSLAKAPIASIRVRVRGASAPDALSQARIATVARLIHERTGLTVDVTAGSSPKPLLIDLPAGKFGRAELLLREGWSKKGASVSFLRAADRKSLALLALFLGTGTFFLANGALATVRTRRREIGTLLTLGWSRPAVFRAVVAELVLVGLAAGLGGTAVAAFFAWLFNLSLPVWRTLLVAPLAVLLIGVAGLVPAWTAARGTPLDALRPTVAGRSHLSRVQHLSTLAYANLRRAPTRVALGAGGLAVGVAALTVLLAIQRAFQGVLVDTLLGQAISIQVQSADFAAAALTIALAGVALADVLYLNLRERTAELVTLRTVGWAEHHVAAVVGLESIGLGLAGSIAGATVGIVTGATLFGVPAAPLVIAAVLAAAGGLAASVFASLIPLSQISRLAAPGVLAED